MNNDLFSAKRSLERAVDAVKDAARIAFRSGLGDPDSPLDYFQATSANLKGFQKKVAAAQALLPALDLDGGFQNLVIHAVTEYQRVEEMVAIEKGRLAQKRAAVAAKADLKKDLNLQEGVSLKGVDVGQYTVILAGLEPVRLHVQSVKKNQLEGELADAVEFFAEFPEFTGKPSYLGTTDRQTIRAINEKHDALMQKRTKWFAQDGLWVCGGASGRKLFTLRADNAQRIASNAQQFALAYVQGYAAKLAMKVGEVIANDANMTRLGMTVTKCEVSSNDLWRNSTARMHLAAATTEDVVENLTFHTQIIWNRSCLGKVFNQYPTRRVE